MITPYIFNFHIFNNFYRLLTALSARSTNSISYQGIKCYVRLVHLLYNFPGKPKFVKYLFNYVNYVCLLVFAFYNYT